MNGASSLDTRRSPVPSFNNTRYFDPPDDPELPPEEPEPEPEPELPLLWLWLVELLPFFLWDFFGVDVPLLLEPLCPELPWLVELPVSPPPVPPGLVLPVPAPPVSVLGWEDPD